MSTYLLVHGAWHGAWCWYKVVASLERAGHAVISPDLPGLGRDHTPLSEVSLDLWTASICQILDGESAPVVLVGHSLGGTVISQVAERRPDAIRGLIYVAAFLLQDGQTARGVLRQDGSSLILKPGAMSADSIASMVVSSAAPDIFYGQWSQEDIALARLLLRPQPQGPGATPVAVSEKHFGRAPRAYIECLRDRAVPLAAQKTMYSALPCRRVFSIDTDHSPFFSAPDDLVSALQAFGSDVK